ncbi:fumarylacetoacetate hydrolase family protein [Bradyrhizobium australiense]|uniref:Fumarylacetoacetate hydrolase family protein n=1 Tax=Bradyrhizobium australiense TaxID=2721161 RepID=A0A7Y4LZB5_9BRAD|nr:fumarylacetoacetate hydrolase family protein [Bradyrhizobium australiense]NOJ43620.1 fumarylacetoacetate hydrolase family protein [Bradyrhizobium australiense]
MKFVSFSKQGFVRAGVLLGNGAGHNDQVVDLAHPSMREALRGVAPQMLALIEAGLPDVVERIRAHRLAEEAKLSIASVTLTAPLPAPRRIFGIAHNYRDALAERGMPPPEKPVLFMKALRTITGAGQAIVLPAGIGGVTYEAELAAVIGTRAEKVGKDRALDHVVAYGCFNDISASEIIKTDGHFDRGKNFATFGPFGPYLASRDEVRDPHALAVSLKVDGRVLQSGSTRDMLFDVADLVSYLSVLQPLEPGDIIATGTPAGVAALHKPPAWLTPGSTVEVEVEGLGRLRNPVIEGSAPDA